MVSTSKFTGLELYALWDASQHDPLPRPFFFSTRTKLDTDFQREKAEALNAAQERHGEFCAEIIDAMVHPDLSIVVSGCDGRAPRDPAGVLRLLAVRRGARGYLVSQQTGETFWEAKGFTVTTGEAVALAEMVARAMPQTEPGRMADITLTARDGREELDYRYGRSRVGDSFEESNAERAHQFRRTVAPSEGAIEIVQGRSLFGPRFATRHRLEWRDLEDDGRYLIDDGRHPPVASATDRRRLVSMINVKVAEVVQAIKDERL